MPPRSLRLNARRSAEQSQGKPSHSTTNEEDVDGKKRSFFSRAALSRVVLLGGIFLIMGGASVVMPPPSSLLQLRGGDTTPVLTSNPTSDSTATAAATETTNDNGGGTDGNDGDGGTDGNGDGNGDDGGNDSDGGNGDDEGNGDGDNDEGNDGDNDDSKDDGDESASALATLSSEVTFPLPECSEHEKEVVYRMFDKAETSCHERDWLEEHYWEHVIGPSATRERDTFLVLVVGCNKGFDAIETARLGSADAAYDTAQWRDALKVAIDGGYSIACDKNGTEQIHLPQDDNLHPPKSTEAHCIEPMTTTIHALEKASEALKLGEHGFVVTKAAIGAEDGEVLFPKSTNFGDEDPSFYKCAEGGTHDKENCEMVPTYQLDSYVNQFVTTDKEAPVDMLLIDAEGYDVDVLEYGAQTLKRTTFLEFENHGVGKWLDHPLRKVLDHLETPPSDGGLGFVCYFVGRTRRVVRVTGCWHDVLGRPQWSNLACVRPERDMELAVRIEQSYRTFYQEMEQAFQNKDNWVRSEEEDEDHKD